MNTNTEDVAVELRRLAAMNIPSLKAGPGQSYSIGVLGARWTVDLLSWTHDVATQVEDEGLIFTWARTVVARMGLKITFVESEAGVEVTLHAPGRRVMREGTCGLLVLLRALREACTIRQQPVPWTPRQGGYSRQQA